MKFIWIVVGIALIALCIQNRKKIAAWRTARRAKKVAARAAALIATTGGAPITAAKKRDWKKQFEMGIAFAKLAALLVFIGVLFVFLVGPKYFWGDYYAAPPQIPAGQVAPAQTAMYPQSFARIAPVGSINDPPEKWSAPLRVNGRKFTADAKGTKDTMPMAVWADGMVLVVAPGVHPHIASPKEVRFLSLTNIPLEIVGTIE